VAAAWAAWAEWTCKAARLYRSKRGPGGDSRAFFFLVRPAGRTYLEVEVLYTPDTGKC
jgi:hypothetical protein